MTKNKTASSRAAKTAESKNSNAASKEQNPANPSADKGGAAPLSLDDKQPNANKVEPPSPSQLLDVASADGEEQESTQVPKKQKLEFEGSLSREEACAQLEAIVKGLAKGSLQLQAKGQSIRLSPSHHFEFELKASSKGSKERLCLELSWRADPEQSLEVIVDDKK